MQSNPYTSVIFAAATADETAGVRDMSSFDNIVTYITCVGTISTGTVTIEEAADVGSATWSTIGSAYDLTALTGGGTTAIHLTNSAYKAIRWRLSDAVTGTGGSCTVTVVAH